MSKVLHAIERLSNNLESNWEEELKDLNIWEDISPLYYKFDSDNYKANVIFAFIVFAYDRKSKKIDMHMDRMENKRKILTSLAGLSAMADQDYVDAAVGLYSPYNEMIEYYINYQKDRRWRDVVSFYDFHSRASVMATMATGPKDMEFVGRVLKQATGLRNDADAIVEKLEKENVLIDSALAKENRVKLSDRRGEDFMSHEIYMRGLKQREVDELAGDVDIMNEYEDD